MERDGLVPGDSAAPAPAGSGWLLTSAGADAPSAPETTWDRVVPPRVPREVRKRRREVPLERAGDPAGPSGTAVDAYRAELRRLLLRAGAACYSPARPSWSGSMRS